MSGPSATKFDRDVAEARAFLAERSHDPASIDVVQALLGHLDERLAVNVGLVAENADLKRRVRELSETPASAS